MVIIVCVIIIIQHVNILTESKVYFMFTKFNYFKFSIMLCIMFIVNTIYIV